MTTQPDAHRLAHLLHTPGTAHRCLEAVPQSQEALSGSLEASRQRLILITGERVLDAPPGTRQNTIIEAAKHLASAGIYEPLGTAVLIEAARHTIPTATGADPTTLTSIRNLIVLGWATGEHNPLPLDEIRPERDPLTDLDEIATAWHRHRDRRRGWWRRQIVMENALRAAYEEGSHISVPMPRKRLGAAEDPLASPTVVTVLEELTEAGWLTLLRPGRPGEAARYALSTPASMAEKEMPSEANRLALLRWLTDACPATQYWDAVARNNLVATRPTSAWLATDPTIPRHRHSIFRRSAR